MRRDDRLKALERELKKAQQMYEVVVGFQGRIKWRREMEAVQYEIRKITESENYSEHDADNENDPLPEIHAAESGMVAAVKPGIPTEDNR